MTKEEFLNLLRGQQIKMLFVFCIKDTFSLTPMSFLNKFEEDIETTTNSDALLSSCTQGCGIMIGAPPIFSLKRKFHDVNIRASPKTTTSKPKQ